MDVKIRKLVNTISSGQAFTGSFSWVHFNVFAVFHVPLKILILRKGSMGVFVVDGFVRLCYLDETISWLSSRCYSPNLERFLMLVFVHFINWIFFVVG